MNAPWTFDEALSASGEASRAQETVEEEVRTAYRQFAEAEESYRKALALEIVRLHDSGVAWTVCADLARGEQHVAELRRLRDIAEGVREAASQASWRRSADRRDVALLAEWSMRRDLAEGNGYMRSAA